jgi:MSHA biogenesis protein MshM
MLAYGENVQKVTRLHMKLSIKDTEAAVQTSSTLRKLSVGVLVAMVACCLVYFTWLRLNT